MSETITRTNKNQTETLLLIPDEILKDLKEIASFNDITLEDLTYSYIIDGLANDSRIIKRLKFKRHAGETFGKDNFHSRSSREIINDFNLVY